MIRRLFMHVLIASFLSSIICAPLNSSETKTDTLENAQEKIIQQPRQLTVKDQFGRVIESYSGSSGKLVICVSDRHADYTAQLNIANLLGELTSKYGVNLVCLEGASKPLDTSFYDEFPDGKEKDKVAKYFLQKGFFTGSEYFKILNKNLTLNTVGVENKEYYLEHIDKFQKNRFEKKLVNEYITALQTNISVIKDNLYNQPLKDTDALIEKFSAQEIKLADYVDNLIALSSVTGVSISDYPNLERYNRLNDKEKSINFSKAEVQREKLINKLSKNLTKNEAKELISKTLRFKLQKITPENYYSYLYTLYLYLYAIKGGIEQEGYTDLVEYVDYIRLARDIDFLEISDELNAFVTALQNAFCENHHQERIVKYNKTISILSDLYKLKVTRDIMNFVKNNPLAFNIALIENYLKSLGEDFSIPITSELAMTPVTENAVKNVFEYYTLAIDRDYAMINNTLQNIDEYGTNMAVLVTGGFHTKGITHILREKNVSYVVVSPTPGTGEYDQIYVNRMLGRELDIHQLANFFADTLVIPLITSDTSAEERINYAKRAFSVIMGLEFEAAKQRQDDPNWKSFTAQEIETLLSDINSAIDMVDKVTPNTLFQIVHEIVIDQRMTDFRALDKAGYSTVLDDAIDELDLEYGDRGTEVAQLLKNLRADGKIYAVNGLPEGINGHAGKQGIYIKDGLVNVDNIVHEALAYAFAVDHRSVENIMRDKNIGSDLEINPIPERLSDEMRDFAAGAGTNVASASDIINAMNQAALLGQAGKARKYASKIFQSVDRKAQRGDFTRAKNLFDVFMRDAQPAAINIIEDVRLGLFMQMYGYENLDEQKELSPREFVNLNNAVKKLNNENAQNFTLPSNIQKALNTLKESNDAEEIVQNITFIRTFLSESNLANQALAGAIGLAVMEALNVQTGKARLMDFHLKTTPFQNALLNDLYSLMNENGFIENTPQTPDVISKNNDENARVGRFGWMHYRSLTRGEDMVAFWDFYSNQTWDDAKEQDQLNWGKFRIYMNVNPLTNDVQILSKLAQEVANELNIPLAFKYLEQEITSPEYINDNPTPFVLNFGTLKDAKLFHARLAQKTEYQNLNIFKNSINFEGLNLDSQNKAAFAAGYKEEREKAKLMIENGKPVDRDGELIFVWTDKNGETQEREFLYAMNFLARYHNSLDVEEQWKRLDVSFDLKALDIQKTQMPFETDTTQVSAPWNMNHSYTENLELYIDRLKNGDVPEVGVIPDIHGNASRVEQILDDLILKSGVRKLVFLGDIFDRGTQNLQIYIMLKSLKERGTYKGVKLDDVQILMGNHDLFTLLGILGDDLNLANWNANGGARAIKEFTGLDLQQFKGDFKAFAEAVRNHQLIKEIAGWMVDNMNLYHVDSDHGMLYLHAGVPINEDGSPNLEYHGEYGIQALQRMEDDFKAALKNPDLAQQGLTHLANARLLKEYKKAPKNFQFTPQQIAELEFDVVKGKPSPAAVFDVLSDTQNSPLWVREGNWLGPLQKFKFIKEYLSVIRDELPEEKGLTTLANELQNVIKELTSEKTALSEKQMLSKNDVQKINDLEAVLVIIKFALVTIDSANPERRAGYDPTLYGLTPEVLSQHFDESLIQLLNDTFANMQDAMNKPLEAENIVRNFINAVIDNMDDRFGKLYEQLGVNGIVFGHTPGSYVKQFDNNIFGIDLKMVANQGGGMRLGQQGVDIKGFMDPKKDRLESLMGGVDIVTRINGLEKRLNKAKGITPEQASQLIETQTTQSQLNPDSLLRQARMKDSMIQELDKLINTETTPDDLRKLLADLRLNIDPAADIIGQLRNILEDDLFDLTNKQNRILMAHALNSLLQPDTSITNAVNINFTKDAQLLEMASLFLEKISELPVQTPTQDSIRETQTRQLDEKELIELLGQRDKLLREVMPFLNDVNLEELSDLKINFTNQNVLLENARTSLETADFKDKYVVQTLALQLILGIQPGYLIENAYMDTILFDFSAEKLWADIGLIETFLNKMLEIDDLGSEMPPAYTSQNVRMERYDLLKQEQKNLHTVLTPVQIVHIRAMSAALRGNIAEAVRILTTDELRNLAPEDAMLYLNARNQYEQSTDQAQSDLIVARIKLMRQLGELNYNNVLMRHFRAPNAVMNKLKRIDQKAALAPLADLASQSLKDVVVKPAVENTQIRQYILVEDINGDLERLKNNLIESGIINSSGVWIAPEGTQLLQLGIRSEQVFDFLNGLAMQAQTAGSEIINLIGRQELKIIQAEDDQLFTPNVSLGWDTPWFASPKLKQAVIKGQIKAAGVVNGKLVINGLITPTAKQLLISEIAQDWNLSPHEVNDNFIAEYMNTLLVNAIKNNDYSHSIFRSPESGGLVLADIGIAGLGKESQVHRTIDQAFAQKQVETFPNKIIGKTIYLIGDSSLNELAPGQRGHAGIKRNAIYIARGAVTVNGQLNMDLLKKFAGHEAFELMQWQEKAVKLFLSSEFEQLISMGLIKAGDDKRDQFAQDQTALEQERAIDRKIKNYDQYKAALRSEYSRVLQNWPKMTRAQRSEAWNKLSPWTQRELRKMLRAWSIAYNKQALELSEQFHNEANRVSPVPPAQEIVRDKGDTLPGRRTMVAPMETVAPDTAEEQLANATVQSTVSYDVGFLVNAFSKVDGNVMRDIDKTLNILEELRANLEGSLSQATEPQLDRLDRLVTSRKNIAQLLSDPRISEVIAAINKIGDLLKTDDQQTTYDPALVDYVAKLLASELPAQPQARLQIINLTTADSPRKVNMTAVLDVLQDNLGVINQIDDFHFNKFVEAVQAYVVLNVGAQMISGNIAPDTMNNLERLTPVMALIYNRAGISIKDNFKGTANNLAKRTGFVKPDLPAIAEIKQISNRYAQMVDIIDNVSFDLKNAGGMVIADIGIAGIGNESVVHWTIDTAFRQGQLKAFPQQLLGKTVYLVGDENLMELAPGQRGHAGVKRNAIYIARGAVTVDGQLNMDLLKRLAGHEAIELMQWQEKAVDIFFSGEHQHLIAAGLITLGDDKRDQFAQDKIALQQEQDMDNRINSFARYQSALMAEYQKNLRNWNQLSRQEKNQAWNNLSPWMKRELRKMLRAWSIAYNKQALELSEQFHNEANRVSPVPPAQEIVTDRGRTTPNGTVIVAPMESVQPGNDEKQPVTTQAKSTVSYDVGFLVNAFSKVDGNVMRDIDKTLNILEELRANLEGSLSQATEPQLDRLDRLVTSRKNIAQLLSDPRISEVIAAVNKIDDLLKTDDQQTTYDPALVDYVAKLLASELPAQPQARLQIINLTTADSPRKVNMTAVLDVLQDNLGVINQIDDFHFNKFVEAVQAYVVLNVGAQMISGNIAPDTMNNLERLTPVMALIYNRAGISIKDNFKGTANNLAKRTGFVKPDLPAIAEIKQISNRYAQMVDIIDNVSFDLKNAGGMVIADIGIAGIGNESVVHWTIDTAFRQGQLKAFPQQLIGKTVYLVGDENLMELAPGQRGHAGVKRNAIYIARGAVTVDGQLNMDLLKRLAGHEAIELMQWQEKAVDIFFSGEHQHLIAAGLITLGDDKRDQFAQDKIALQQEQDMDNRINSFARYQSALMAEYQKNLRNWNQLSRQEKNQAWNNLSPWMKRELRKMLRAWSIAYNKQALELSEQFHNEANRVSPVPPAQEIVTDRGRTTPNGTVIVAPMESVQPGNDEKQPVTTQAKSTVSYDVGFLVNAFSKVDGNVMRDIDKTLNILEELRANLEGSLSQATEPQLDRLDRLVTSRKNIAQLLSDPRISEVIAAVNKIGDLLKTDDQQTTYDPALVDYVAKLLASELPAQPQARLQIINLTTADSPRKVNMTAVLDVLQDNLGVINQIDDFHFNKFVEAVQAYVVLNVGAQMISGNIAPDTMNNLERLTPVMALIYNRAGISIKDNFKGTANNLAKRTGFVKPDLPAIAEIKQISNRYAQMVDIIDNVSFDLKNAGGMVIADIGIAGIGNESVVHWTIDTAFRQGQLKAFPQQLLGKTVYLVGDENLMELAPGQRGHAGVKRNAIYIARGAVTVDGQLNMDLLKRLAGHEAIELMQWQEKAVDIFFSGEHQHLIAAGLITLGDDKRDQFAQDKIALQQEQDMDNRINSFARYQSALMAEYQKNLRNWNQLSRQEKNQAWNNLSPWMKRELRKMLRAWSIAYNKQALELSEQFHNEANRVSPVPPVNEAIIDIGAVTQDGTVIVAPMESVNKGTDERNITSPRTADTQNTISFNVGFIINNLAGLDNMTMRDVDAALQSMEKIRETLRLSIGKASEAQKTQLKQLVQSRRQIVSIIPVNRRQELLDMLDTIGEVIENKTSQLSFEPALIEFVNGMMADEGVMQLGADVRVSDLLQARIASEIDMDNLLTLLSENRGISVRLNDLQFKKLVEGVQAYLVLQVGGEIYNADVDSQTLINLDKLRNVLPLVYNRANEAMRKNLKLAVQNIIKRVASKPASLDQIAHIKNTAQEFEQIFAIIDNNVASSTVFAGVPVLKSVVGGMPVNVTDTVQTGFFRVVANPDTTVMDQSVHVPLTVLSDWHIEAERTAAMPIRINDVVVKAKFISGNELPVGMGSYYFVDAQNNIVIVTNEHPRNVNSISDQEYSKALLVLKLMNQIGAQDDTQLFFEIMNLLNDIFVNTDQPPVETVVKKIALNNDTAVIGKDSVLYSPLGTFAQEVVQSANENTALSGPLFILVQNTVLNYLNATEAEQPVRLDRIERANTLINRSL